VGLKEKALGDQHAGVSEARGTGDSTGLKKRALRGGAAKALAQVASFVLKIGSTAILARMLDPEDFGLVAMVTAVTGVLHILKDAGLSLPTVQRQSITDGQLSTLFWLNALVGLVLTGLCAALAWPLADLYHDSRLVLVTLATAPAFVINALSVQHNAILMRRMQFPTLAMIDVLSLLVSYIVAITMAFLGWSYWALVAMSVVQAAVGTLATWWAARWWPGALHFDSELRSMVKLGGALTLNSVMVYIAYNLDKLLLGRYWGAGALGLYGRGYVLVNIPTDSLNTAVGNVALSALSRLQDDPPKLRAYFLKGYSLVVTLTVPITLVCALFAEEIVAVLLGPKWGETAIIVRLLAPTILAFGLLNPMFWLLFSSGLMRRSLQAGVVVSALVVVAYGIGLPYGPRGVAAAYSAALMVWTIPHLAWCVHGTSIRLRDLARALAMPVLAGLAAAGACLALKDLVPMSSLALVRLLEGGALYAAVYAIVLLFVMRQLSFYLDLARSLFQRSAPAAPQEAVGGSAG
jgi:PST family polysaccharide transporter